MNSEKFQLELSLIHKGEKKMERLLSIPDVCFLIFSLIMSDLAYDCYLFEGAEKEALIFFLTEGLGKIELKVAHELREILSKVVQHPPDRFCEIHKV